MPGSARRCARAPKGSPRRQQSGPPGGRTGRGQAGRAIAAHRRRAAIAREPHRIAFFLYDLAAAFHAFWNFGNDKPEKRFIVAQDPATEARLFLPNRAGYP
jgi:hypothetical protein